MGSSASGTDGSARKSRNRQRRRPMSAGQHVRSYGRGMQAAHPFSPADLLRAVEDRFVLRGLRWEDYLALLEAREGRWPRITFLDGEIELMAPSDGHEWIKTTTG